MWGNYLPLYIFIFFICGNCCRKILRFHIQNFWREKCLCYYGFSKDIGFLSGTLFLFSPFFYAPNAQRIVLTDEIQVKKNALI
jgi:hypothetical protein